MRLLFEIDTKDYDPNGKPFVRPSVRGIIIRDGKVAMVHSLKYDYYKFPGGGMEDGEGLEEALLRRFGNVFPAVLFTRCGGWKKLSCGKL